MSKRIGYIIQVLNYIQNEYDGSSSVTPLRIKAMNRVAKENNLDITTIRDAFRRRLQPEIANTKEFDNSVFEWLTNDNLKLQDVILTHKVDQNDVDLINNFFSQAIDAIIEVEFSIKFGTKEFKEGKQKYVTHLRKERNQTLIKEAKRLWAKGDEKLISCSVCSFNFYSMYSTIGLGFIEAHHTKPISEVTEETVVSVEDLAPVCSNCHRMIHKSKPWLTIEQLKGHLKSIEQNFK